VHEGGNTGGLRRRLQRTEAGDVLELGLMGKSRGCGGGADRRSRGPMSGPVSGVGTR
jgi:hypothetical protein